MSKRRSSLRVQSPAAPPPRAKNLLDYGPVAAIAHSRYFPVALQWMTASVFMVIVWQLLLGPQSAHENAGTALVWVLWWPLLPVLFLTLGRFWCAVCPFGWLSDPGAEAGRRSQEGAEVPEVLWHLGDRRPVHPDHLGRPCLRHRRVPVGLGRPAAGAHDRRRGVRRAL